MHTPGPPPLLALHEPEGTENDDIRSRTCCDRWAHRDADSVGRRGRAVGEPAARTKQRHRQRDRDPGSNPTGPGATSRSAGQSLCRPDPRSNRPPKSIGAPGSAAPRHAGAWVVGAQSSWCRYTRDGDPAGRWHWLGGGGGRGQTRLCLGAAAYTPRLTFGTVGTGAIAPDREPTGTLIIKKPRNKVFQKSLSRFRYYRH